MAVNIKKSNVPIINTSSYAYQELFAQTSFLYKHACGNEINRSTYYLHVIFVTLFFKSLLSRCTNRSGNEASVGDEL